MAIPPALPRTQVPTPNYGCGATKGKCGSLFCPHTQQGESQGRGGEEELGTELFVHSTFVRSQYFPNNQAYQFTVISYK